MTPPDQRYPFTSRKQITSRILTDQTFARECAIVLQARTDERDAGRAPAGKPWGWMSSQKATASKIVAKLRAGMLSSAEEAKLRKMIASYGRQLADHFRTLEIRRRPELAEVARVFGVATPATPAPPARGGDAPAGAGEERQESADREEPLRDGEGVGLLENREDDTASRVVAVLAETPGLRSEEIATRTGIGTAYLGPELRAMVEAGTLRKTGAARGTRYFLA